MDGEVELISDDDGLAILGSPSAVERFMASVGLSSTGSHRMGSVIHTGSALAQTSSEIAANSGRWVKLTEESARAVKDLGLTPTKTPGVSHAMVGDPGDIKQWIQIVTKPGSILTNPAMLAGAAGIMAQVAMQQQMDAILDYLAVIDEKLDDVLRCQTNQVLARLDGVELAVKEAMSVRSSVGRVSDVTWSKVQASAQTIHEVEGYALRHLADLADKLEQKVKVGELADTLKEAETEVQKWLIVLAHCFELHDAVGVLELDRVMDSSPDELDRHRVGLRSARQDRLELISARTVDLLERMRTAVSVANSKVLFNPKQSPAVVRSTNRVASDVHEFRDLLGVETGHEASESRRWSEAAAEQWGKARATGGQGVESVKRIGSGAQRQASAAKGKLSNRFSERKHRRSVEDEHGS